MADVNLVEEATKINGFGSKLELEGENRRMHQAIDILKSFLGMSNFSSLRPELPENEIAISVPSGEKALTARRIVFDLEMFLGKVDMVTHDAQTHGVTTAELINDARNNFTGIDKELPLNEYIQELPEVLEKILYEWIRGVDYKKSKRKTSYGVAVCDLATIIAALQDKLEEKS